MVLSTNTPNDTELPIYSLKTEIDNFVNWPNPLHILQTYFGSKLRQ